MDDKELITILVQESEMLRSEAFRVRGYWDAITRDYWNLQEKYTNQFQQFIRLKHENARLEKELAELKHKYGED